MWVITAGEQWRLVTVYPVLTANNAMTCHSYENIEFTLRLRTTFNHLLIFNLCYGKEKHFI